MRTPWFFERLGIEPTEDSKTIKKAYAVELKKIDQETQAKEFEKLREAYELARSWRSKSEPESDFAFEGSQVEPEYCDEQEVPYAFESTVPLNVAHVDHAERLNQTLNEDDSDEQTASERSTAQISYASTEHHHRQENKLTVGTLFIEFVSQIAASPNSAETLLAKALNSESLIPLDARMEFEHRLAEWLHNNPFPHFPLFEAAVDIFRWHEQVPLHQNFQVVAWLRLVVEQWQQWDLQTAEWQMCVLLALTKSNAMISLKEKQALATACARYPLLMRLRVSEERWDEVSSPAISIAEPKSRRRSKILIIIAMWLFASAFIVGVMSVLDDHFNYDWKRPEKTQPPALQLSEAQKKNVKQAVENIRLKHKQESEDLLRKQNEMITVNQPKKPAVQAPVEKEKTEPVSSSKKNTKQPPTLTVTSFNMSPELCQVRSVLVGRWADLYANDINHQSFKNEVEKCLDKGWWPKGKTAADKYLKRLAASWASPDYPNNKLLEGLELEARHRGEDPDNDLVMMCDRDRRVNPFIFPEGADCVSLAATYQPPKINANKASPEFCQLREKATNWHFDQGNEWNNYLVFKQEITECFQKGWWDRQNFKRDVKRLKSAWRESVAR